MADVNQGQPGPEEDDEVSFDAVNAGSENGEDLDDDMMPRPIDLDTPLDLGEAISAAARPRRRHRDPAHSPADATQDGAGAGDGAEATANGAGPSVSDQELQAQAAEANDKYLRTLAEFQNYKRRTDEDIRRRVQEGNEKLIRELLPVLDDFDLALNAARQAESYEQLIGGVEAIARKFEQTLARQGVTPIPALGEPFDHDLHEAVMLDEQSDEPDETVTQELRRGYQMHDRVIRPTLVKVAKQ